MNMVKMTMRLMRTMLMKMLNTDLLPMSQKTDLPRLTSCLIAWEAGGGRGDLQFDLQFAAPAPSKNLD